MGCEIVVGGASRRRARSHPGAVRGARRGLQPVPRGQRAEPCQPLRGTVVPVSTSVPGRARGRARGGGGDATGSSIPTLGAALEAAGYTQRLLPASARIRRPQGLRSAGRLAGRPSLAGGCSASSPACSSISTASSRRSRSTRRSTSSNDGFVSAGGDLRRDGRASMSGSPVAERCGSCAARSRRAGARARSWRRGGELQHHLIDPRTGRPADSPWEQVTVSGDTCLARTSRQRLRSCSATTGPIGSRNEVFRGGSWPPTASIVATRDWSVEEAVACT